MKLTYPAGCASTEEMYLLPCAARILPATSSAIFAGAFLACLASWNATLQVRSPNSLRGGSDTSKSTTGRPRSETADFTSSLAESRTDLKVMMDLLRGNSVPQGRSLPQGQCLPSLPRHGSPLPLPCLPPGRARCCSRKRHTLECLFRCPL